MSAFPTDVTLDRRAVAVPEVPRLRPPRPAVPAAFAVAGRTIVLLAAALLVPGEAMNISASIGRRS